MYQQVWREVFPGLVLQPSDIVRIQAVSFLLPLSFVSEFVVLGPFASCCRMTPASQGLMQMYPEAGRLLSSRTSPLSGRTIFLQNMTALTTLTLSPKNGESNPASPSTFLREPHFCSDNKEGGLVCWPATSNTWHHCPGETMKFFCFRNCILVY